MNPDRRLITAVLTATAVIAGVGASLGVAIETADAAAAVDRPDLKVTSASLAATSIVEGAELRITHTVRNGGTKPAVGTKTRFYLTTDVAGSQAARKASRTNPRSSAIDIRLDGSAPIGALKPGRSDSATARAVVPVGTPPAAYTVLACADDGGAVKEGVEHNNCTPAGKVKVKVDPGSDDLELQTFADTANWPANENFPLQMVKIVCASSYPVKRYTLGGALTSIRSFLDEQAPGAVTQLRESGQADTPEKAQELAATALAGGSPGLALASLLEAHRLQPSRGTHLVNAAALATSVGLPNEALALLDASVGRDFLRAPFALPPSATAAAIRGQALVMLGKYDAARPLFVAAKQQAPMLTEADAGLAAVAACKGEDAVAKRYIRRSRQRSDDPVPTTPPVEMPTDPEPRIDLGRGYAVPLRQLPIAETPQQGADMNVVYDGIADGFEGEIMANIDRTNALEAHLRETDELRTRAEIDRRNGIMVRLYRTHEDELVEALQQEIFDKLDLLTEHYEKFWGGGTGEVEYTYQQLSDAAFDACSPPQSPPNCYLIEMNRTCRPALTNAHTQWRGLISETQTLANEYFERWSTLMTGYAANLIDEEAHRLALVHVDMLERDTYALLVQQAQHWTHSEELFREECVDPLPPEVLEAPANEDVESKAKCDGALKAMNLRATLGPSTLKVSCERIEQGFAVPVLPLLEAFADVKFDFKTGNVSVFMGSKGGGIHTGVEATWKSGVYVKVNQQGELVDVGWRTGPSVSVGAGAAEFSAYEGEIDMSFITSTNPGY